MPLNQTVKVVYWLRAHSITAIEILYIPFLSLTLLATLQTPRAAIDASPLYHQMERVAPLNAWLLVLGLCAISLVAGIVTQRLLWMILGYIVSAAIWLAVAGLIYNLAHTYQTSFVYVFVGGSAIYRASDLWVTVRAARNGGTL